MNIQQHPKSIYCVTIKILIGEENLELQREATNYKINIVGDCLLFEIWNEVDDSERIIRFHVYIHKLLVQLIII